MRCTEVAYANPCLGVWERREQRFACTCARVAMFLRRERNYSLKVRESDEAQDQARKRMRKKDACGHAAKCHTELLQEKEERRRSDASAWRSCEEHMQNKHAQMYRLHMQCTWTNTQYVVHTRCLPLICLKIVQSVSSPLLSIAVSCEWEGIACSCGIQQEKNIINTLQRSLHH